MLQVVATHAGRLRRGAPRPESRSPAAHSDLPLAGRGGVPEPAKLRPVFCFFRSDEPACNDPRRGCADDTRGRPRRESPFPQSRPPYGAGRPFRIFAGRGPWPANGWPPRVGSGGADGRGFPNTRRRLRAPWASENFVGEGLRAGSTASHEGGEEAKRQYKSSSSLRHSVFYTAPPPRLLPEAGDR